MKKIIALNGGKHSGKDRLALKWDTNSDVHYIHPVCSRHKDLIDNFPYHQLLCSTMINGVSYNFYDSQLVDGYNVLIVDDYALKDLVETNYEVIAVWVDNPKSELSERSGRYYGKEEYDYIYNYGLDEQDTFLEQIAFDSEVMG